MTKILTLMIGMIFLLTIINVSAEVTLWDTVIKDQDNSLVNYHAYYQFEDTSASGIGMSKDIPITFWYTVEALPFDLTGYGGEVDWCNFTIIHYRNIYDTHLSFVWGQGWYNTGTLLNTTTEIQSYYFESSPFTSEQVTVNIRKDDYLSASMKCHYTNSSTLYVENALIGRFTTYMPSFECAKCDQYNFEQATYQTDNEANITQNELIIYNRIQTVIDWDFQIWLILSWIIKIVFLLIAVGLIFSAVYYFYIFLKKISEEI